MMRRLTVGILLLPSLIAQVPGSLEMQQGAPPPVSAVNAIAQGSLGRTPLYYWVIARYAGGVSVPSSVAVAAYTQGPANLSVSNYVSISWPALANATGYDVVRSTSPVYPAPCATAGCAVIVNTASTSVADSGAALSIYTGPSVIPTTRASFTIDNVSAAQPFINVQLLGQSNEVLRLAMISGTPAEGDCMEFSGGRLQSAGAACGSGSGVAAGPSGAISVTGAAPQAIDVTSFVCITTDECAPTGRFDLSASSATLPARIAASDPVLCDEGEQYYNSTSNRLRVCSAANTWSDVGSAITQTQFVIGIMNTQLNATTHSGALTADRVYCGDFTATTNYNVGRMLAWQNTGIGPGDFRFAVYDDAGTLLVTSNAPTSSGNVLYATVSTTLIAGTRYAFCFATDDATLRLNRVLNGQGEEALYNATSNNFYYCANTMSGTTMPATCGAKTALTGGLASWVGITN